MTDSTSNSNSSISSSRTRTNGDKERSSSSSYWQQGWIFGPSSFVPVVLLSVAFYYYAQHYQHQQDDVSPTTTPENDYNNKYYATYIIGDLHGDVHCAQYWVNRTGLIRTSSSASASASREWTDPTSHLVFMGDYIDKGPTSKQTLEYVKSLTEEFPQHVTALLGNHEMELLLDRDEERKRWGNVHEGGDITATFYQLAYASAHPAEYLNFLSNGDDTLQDKTTAQTKDKMDDELIVDALYNASLEVYGRGLHANMFMIPNNDDIDANGHDDDDRSILSFIPDKRIREAAHDRLKHFQEQYIGSFRSGTSLGSWLEQRPIVFERNGTLLVHGGIDFEGDDGRMLSMLGVDGINQLFFNHSTDDMLSQFIMETYEGQAIYSMLTYRGNHRTCPTSSSSSSSSSSSPNSLLQLPKKKKKKKPLLYDDGYSSDSDSSGGDDDDTVLVRRLGVGHTPSSDVKILCDGTFMSLDSSLSRWFRNSGNDYCHGHTEQTSNNNQYRCYKMNNECQGQIVRILDGRIEVIE